MSLFLDSLRIGDGVDLEYRLDGSLFSIRKFHAHTKTSVRQLVDLQYADAAAILSHSLKIHAIHLEQINLHIQGVWPTSKHQEN